MGQNSIHNSILNILVDSNYCRVIPLEALSILPLYIYIQITQPAIWFHAEECRNNLAYHTSRPAQNIGRTHVIITRDHSCVASLEVQWTCTYINTCTRHPTMGRNAQTWVLNVLFN